MRSFDEPEGIFPVLSPANAPIITSDAWAAADAKPGWVVVA